MLVVINVLRACPIAHNVQEQLNVHSAIQDIIIKSINAFKVVEIHTLQILITKCALLALFLIV